MLLKQLRAMKGVIVKEVLLLCRYPTWPIQLFIFPFLIVLHYIFIGKTFVGSTDEVSSLIPGIGFIVIGYVLYLWGNSILWSLGMSLRMEKMRGTLEHQFLIPLPSILLLAAYSLGSLLENMIMITFVLFLVKILFNFSLYLNIPLIALAFLLTWFALYGFGLAFAGLVMRFKDANSLALIFDSFLMVLSGALYPLSILPGFWQKVAYLSPLTVPIQTLRGILLSNWSWVDSWKHFIAMLVYGVVMLYFGWLFYTKMVKDARVKGSIGHF